MSRPSDPHAELRATICEGRAILVAGTGVSIGATRQHPQASWAGLLKHGLAWLREHDLISDGKAQAHLSLIDDDDAETHHFVSAAQDITRQMGGRASVHYKEWLEETVGSLVAKDRAPLETLDALRAHGNLLATTNYDSLLLGDSRALTPVTWRQQDEFLEAVRNKQTDKVLYLHGYWRRPESVVLDWTSYEQIARDDQYRADLAACWHLSTWVYVGCGVNGLADPDLGLLLDRYGRRLREAGLWDYFLVRSDQHDEIQAHFDEHELNVVAVPFGDSHTELPGYLRSLLPAPTPTPTPDAPPSPVRASAGAPQLESVPPSPPELYALPDYLGSHDFVGRGTELRDLDEWARPADPTNLLLFEAIGGNGKSMLTWQWLNDRAPVVRTDWAGRFWYSFYERGAVMADFCRHALAYMRGQPPEAFRRARTTEMASELVAELHAKPWLLVLDGLERVLVAYHRIDAAHLLDEAADDPTDTVSARNPTATIRDEDGDLLRVLAGAGPSKILVTARLTPQVLLNQAGQPIPGAKRQPLGGLRPDDAEAMFRATGAHGNSARIRSYLTKNCDNHPLMIGVLAGLVVNYLPARGDFDAWVDDMGPNGGGQLEVGELDLVQRRHHILRAAIHDLPEESRELLSTVALFPESIDYETLSALNPFLPPEPDHVPDPGRLDEDFLSGVEPRDRGEFRRHLEARTAARASHERRLAAWQQSPEVRDAARTLAEAVRDLEQRGLMQYDRASGRHDLHPVVRAVVFAGLEPDDLQRHGQRSVDLFTSMPHSPYERARTLEDVAPALNLVRTLLRLGRLPEAAAAFDTQKLDLTLSRNLEANAELLALLRPFFGSDWSEVKESVATREFVLSSAAGGALAQTGDINNSRVAYGSALTTAVTKSEWQLVSIGLRNLAGISMQTHPARSSRLLNLALDLANALNEEAHVFKSLLWLFEIHIILGRWDEVAATWQQLDVMGRDWPRELYAPGDAELRFAMAECYQGRLREEHLAATAASAEAGQSRLVQRQVHRLRGLWHFDQENWTEAVDSLAEAVRMARERSELDSTAEAALALSKMHLGLLAPDDVRHLATRATTTAFPSHRMLALIWMALGAPDRAKAEAVAEYEEAWADGEPYVVRHDLDRATELLHELGVPVPDLPPFDPEREEPFPWEADVRAAIERLAAAGDEPRSS
jgi:tetratricopeptide (TPR) repeat protein